jgi:rfaE bifunctional protein kinase chain/domain
MEVELIGTVGVDSSSEILIKMMKKAGICYNEHWRSSDAETIVKTRIVAEPQQVCRVDRELGVSSYTLKQDAFSVGILRDVIEACDCIIVSDYAKGVVDQPLYDLVIDMALNLRKLIAVDPKPRLGINYHSASLLTPNRNEALQLLNISDTDYLSKIRESNYANIASAFKSQLDVSNVLVTLGSEGMLVIENAMIIEKLSANAREVFDVSGAGDTVIATVVCGLCSGYSFGQAARFANVAAGLVVGKFGTATVTMEELLEAMSLATS